MATRRQFHQELDQRGQAQYPDWTPRTGATYFWATATDAYVHTGRQHHALVVEIDGVTGAWCAPSDVVERAFGLYGRGEADLNDLIEQAEPYHGQAQQGLEVWATPPVSPDAIRKVGDHTEFAP